MLATAFAVDETYALADAFARERGKVYLTGIQAITRMALMQRRLDRARGLNTAGFVSGYRGSPVAGLDLAMAKARKQLDAEHIHFHPGLNEALAASSILGTQQVEVEGSKKHDGVFAYWYGKGPGVDWAGDALKHGNAFGSSPHGGVLVIAGDDHGAVSSTMAHQSDQTLAAWYLPVLHPATVADYLELGLYGIALSRFSGAWVGFKAVSETVESSGSLLLPSKLPTFVMPSDFTPPEGGLHYRWQDPPSVALEARLQAKARAAEAFARANPVDRLITDPGEARLGIVTVGKAHLDLMEAFRLLGFGTLRDIEALGVRIYKVAQTWPLERQGMRRVVEGLETVLVVEEKRPFVEEQVKTLLYHLDSARRPAILGKTDAAGDPLLPSFGELRPHMLLQPLADRLRAIYPSLDLQPRVDRLTPRPVTRAEVTRVPHFCSGCPHNSSTVVPDGSYSMGGIGCHIMATWMDRSTQGVTQMGGEGSNWIGLAPFVETPHVFQNLGDGTFFHSGSLAIRAAIAARARITYKILFNDAVAMTGGQTHDGPLDPAKITRMVHDEGVQRIVVVTDEPQKYGREASFAPGVEIFHRRDLERVQEGLRDYQGVSVLVYDQTCAAEKRRRRKKGTLADTTRRAVINAAVCEACGDCSKTSNCLSIQPLESALGTKRQIDQSSCNKDFSCQDGFCPSFVTVEGGTLKKGGGLTSGEVELKLASLPHPRLAAVDEVHEILVTGIGGTGVLTVGAVLGMAAHLESRPVSVLDFTGLAQKGGAVLSHVRLANRGEHLHQARIEPGQADVVIGCDLVVAAEETALATMAEGRTHIVGNAHATTTSSFIRDPRFAIHVDRLRQRIAKRAGEESVALIDAHKLALAVTGDAIGANLLLLGYAFQRGLLPLGLRAIERAIELNGVAIQANLRAFAFGRLAAHDPAWLDVALGPKVEQPTTLEEIIAHRRGLLIAYQDEAYAKRYVGFVRQVALVDEVAAREVARNLAKLMAYKDEYEVARLFTDGSFERQLGQEFEGSAKLRYHLAPPMLSWLKDGKGQPRKIAFGPWLRRPMRLLAAMRRLRGTAFDPFGYAAERRAERALVDDYRAAVDRCMEAGDLATLRDMAALPDLIRGFGHVKDAGIERYRARKSELLARLERPAPVAPQLLAAE